MIAIIPNIPSIDFQSTTISLNETEVNKYYKQTSLIIDEKLIESFSSIDQFSSRKLINSINNTFIDYFDSLKLDCNHLEFKDSIKRLSNSIKYFKHFLTIFDSQLLFGSLPEVSIDNDGEITLEWFGCIGTRCTLTFGHEGTIYFNAIRPNASIAYKNFLNKESLPLIETEIKIIIKSKI